MKIFIAIILNILLLLIFYFYTDVKSGVYVPEKENVKENSFQKNAPF